MEALNVKIMFNLYQEIFSTSNIYSAMYIQEKVMDRLLKTKTRNQFHNALRVLYGKKKDRGHLKEKYNRFYEEEKRMYKYLMKAIMGVAEKRGLI